jgi:O-antigen/teichoic acid export membrane protein
MIFWRFNSEQERIDFYNSGELIPFAALLIITLTYSIDILVGKFLFSGEDIGNYSRISLLGKMILFACLSVGTVMFPISSEKHLSGAKSKNIILKSSLLVFLICFAGILFFAFFSKPLVGLLFGQGYIEYSLLLIPLGFAFSFISGINLLVLYGLSIDRFKLKGGLGLIFLFLVQLFCLIRYHESLLVFSYAYAITSGIMFIFTVILSSTWKN